MASNEDTTAAELPPHSMTDFMVPPEAIDAFVEANPPALLSLIGSDTPWPLVAVLGTLLEASEHLLKDHNCDRHGWERVVYARDYAAAYLREARPKTIMRLNAEQSSVSALLLTLHRHRSYADRFAVPVELLLRGGTRRAATGGDGVMSDQEKIKALRAALREALQYRAHRRPCEVAITDFCTCGMKQVADRGTPRTGAERVSTRAVWYRVVDGRRAPPLDEWDNPVGSGQSYARVLEVPVIRRTPKGVWVEGFDRVERFVLLDARKRWACPTFEEAVDSFRARKQRQAKIPRAQLMHVDRVLDARGAR